MHVSTCDGTALTSVLSRRRLKEANVYLADITTSLTNVVTSVYMHTSLVGIVLAMALESCCIPLPSEIVMPLAGVMLVTGKIVGGINPLLGVMLVALAGSLGCLVGYCPPVSPACHWSSSASLPFSALSPGVCSWRMLGR